MAIEVKTQNPLDVLISKTRELFASEPDLDQRWAKLSPILAEMLADPAVIEASKTWPETHVLAGEGGSRAENLLFYEDPDYGFAINGLKKNPDRSGSTRVHDHAHIYTLYGVLDGRERIERYERLDDRSRVDYAEIRRTRSDVVGPGEIDLVKPYEIHTEVTIGESTVAVIIRSEKSGGFNQGRYNPETFEYFESLGPRQTPVEMFPPNTEAM
ncbi:MAG: Cysteine dioxygenase [Chloroflexi bacterium]|nr:Cysteine dioxygenase [Chloroflexota bacterium]